MKAFKGKHVLIAGGGGFIGSNLARVFVKLGVEVTIRDRFIADYGGDQGRGSLSAGTAALLMTGNSSQGVRTMGRSAGLFYCEPQNYFR